MALQEREGVVVALDGVAARQGTEAAVDSPPCLLLFRSVGDAREGLPVPVRCRSRDDCPAALAVLGVAEAGVVRPDLCAGIERLCREGIDVRDVRGKPRDRRGINAANLGRRAVKSGGEGSPLSLLSRRLSHGKHRATSAKSV